MKPEPLVALYWDFENIHAAVLDELHGDGEYRRTASQPQERVIRINAVTAYAASIGTVVINRAYSNWQWFRAYRRSLLESSVDLVQLFRLGPTSKNGADIRMALDVLEDLHHHPHITHVVVVTGDSDFVALAQKCRKSGRMVIGVGVDGATSAYWTAACNEFKFYRTLIHRTEDRQDPEAPHPDLHADLRTDLRADLSSHLRADLGGARALLLEAIRQLGAKTGDEWVVKAAIRPMMTRLDSTFDEANHGFVSFADFLAAASDLLTLRKGEHDHEVAIRRQPEGTPTETRPPSSLETYERRVMGTHRPGRPPLADLMHAVAEAFGGGDDLVDSWEAFVESVAARLLTTHPKAAVIQEARDMQKLLFRLYAFRLLGQGNGIGLRAEVTQDPLRWLLERAIRFLDRELGPDLDLDALHRLFHGFDAEPGDATMDQIAAIIADA